MKSVPRMSMEKSCDGDISGTSVHGLANLETGLTWKRFSSPSECEHIGRSTDEADGLHTAKSSHRAGEMALLLADVHSLRYYGEWRRARGRSECAEFYLAL
jgi:hypothetical protein